MNLTEEAYFARLDNAFVGMDRWVRHARRLFHQYEYLNDSERKTGMGIFMELMEASEHFTEDDGADHGRMLTEAMRTALHDHQEVEVEEDDDDEELPPPPYENIPVQVEAANEEDVDELPDIPPPDFDQGSLVIIEDDIEEIQPPKKRRREAEEEKECSVCLEEIKESDLQLGLYGCNHSFHLVCIGEWLKVSKSCPYCRQVPQNVFVSKWPAEKE